MEVKKESFFKKMTPTDWIALTLILFGVLGFIGLPYLITQSSFLNFKNIEFGKPNEIGDMIGGIVGPFMGLISASLVYLTIREQINANKSIQKQFEKQKEFQHEKVIFEEVINDVKKTVEKIQDLSGTSLQISIKSYNNDLNISKIATASIFDNGNLTTEFLINSEILHFKILFRKLLDNLELFLKNIKNENAFYKIVELKLQNINFYFEESILKVKKFNNLNNRYETTNYVRLEYLDMFICLKSYILFEKQIKQKNQIPKEVEEFYLEFKVFFEIIDFLSDYEILINKFEKVGSQSASFSFSKAYYGYNVEQKKNHNEQHKLILEEFNTIETCLDKLLKDLFKKDIIIKDYFDNYHKDLTQKITNKYIYFPFVKKL